MPGAVCAGKPWNPLAREKNWAGAPPRGGNMVFRKSWFGWLRICM